MSAPDLLRQKLLDNGWLQGSVIDFTSLFDAAKEHGLENGFPPNGTTDKYENAQVIIISMSCDVVFGNIDNELPKIECYICPVNKKLKPNNAKISDPRKMVLIHNNQKLDVRMKNHLFIDRQLLSHLKPSSQLAQNELNSLIRWKVALYNRLGLPESLVARITDVTRRKDFLKWMDDNSDKIEGLFLELPDCSELPITEKYKIGAICLLDSSKIDNNDISELDEQFHELFLSYLDNIDSIELLNTTEYGNQYIDNVISTDEFTYDMLKRFRRYPLDHLSLNPAQNENLIQA
ncbi:hypothetical protein C9J41_17830 [Photobacterium sp. GB-50]|uniref:hypothetical protein n=1 Tax=Photobacterium sp. GB-50 TaxID=2022107 RepID=UPI000D1729E7|nr:hypothetical protein [Photobacterium sp. GB-50]PSW72177.1 hypothetical protein C9J41_17830 [Photobacterium sp. GB-50]